MYVIINLHFIKYKANYRSMDADIIFNQTEYMDVKNHPIMN